MTRITIDPTELQPGDLVLSLGEHEESGCHCDVRVIVDRPEGNPYYVIDNITGQPVRSGLSEDNATGLCRGLNLQAGPGTRYGVRPGVPR